LIPSGTLDRTGPRHLSLTGPTRLALTTQSMPTKCSIRSNANRSSQVSRLNYAS